MPLIFANFRNIIKIEERKFGPTRNEMKDNSETVNIIQKEIDRDGVWLYGRMEGKRLVDIKKKIKSYKHSLVLRKFDD